MYSERNSYLVAKLREERGYTLAYISDFDSIYSDSSVVHNGRVSIEYYYISQSEGE